MTPTLKRHKNCGKKRSKKQRVQLSKSLKKYYATGGKNWNAGKKIDRQKHPKMGHFKKHTIETKKLIGVRSKQMWKNQQFRKKRIKYMKTMIGKKNNFYGKFHSKEMKKKQARTVKKYWKEMGAQERERRKQISKKIGQNNWIFHRRKMLKALKKNHWINSDNAKEIAHKIHIRQVPTKPEKIVREMLINEKLPFKYTGNGDVVLGTFCPDFYNINGDKKVIEVFGEYWHGKEKTGRTKKEEETRYIKRYKQFGHSILILWEKEICSDPDNILNKIREFDGGGKHS